MTDTAPAAPLRCGLLGCGVVGTEVVRLLRTHGEELAQRVGAPLELTGIAVRDLDAERDALVPSELLTTDADAVVDGADVVVEVMGGLEPARTLLLRALERGASVVTANKALVATHGPELYEAAERGGGGILTEAAVAGAVPVVRGIAASLAGDRITRVLGIVNGTTNYVLDEMSSTGADLDDAVASAQRLGYAEADPSADVDGLDAAAKAAILASLAFHSRVRLADVAVEGIRAVTADDVAAAAATGHVVKLLAIAERRDGPDARPGIAVRVHPALVPTGHPLASVHGAYNAVLVEAEAAGTLMFYGQGAGGAPTASAVVGDLVAAARMRRGGARPPAESRYAELPVFGPDAVRTRLQVRLDVEDRAGVLAELAGTVAEHGVSLETVRQSLGEDGAAQLVLVTHEGAESALLGAVDALSGLAVVRAVRSVIRVEAA